MEVIPAIDLRGGCCVRLYQGDYAQETVFSADPVGVARHWEALGASRIHVVDLDGAARGEPVNTAVIAAIAQAVAIPIQVGGGLRTMEAIEHMLALGARRVILGTAAVENEALVAEACRRQGEAIVVGVDARDGMVAVRGWREGFVIRAEALVERMASLGVRRIIYTDIARDGTLGGPNFEATAALVRQSKVPIIVSGGIASLDDLRRLAQIGVEGAVVGRALYTGAIDLREALTAP